MLVLTKRLPKPCVAESVEEMKRKDLQGLRGYAIIAVVLFHFFPHLFPSGYLGVDLFFVLSGFLITMILGRSNIGPKTLSQFYYRRVKRIVPLYYLIMLLIASTVTYLLPLTFIIANVDPFRKSLHFTSNMGKSNELNYFAELDHAKNLFTHTWSLSVEMQYYLLVPFIYFALTKAPSFLHIPLFSLICVFSLTYQCSFDSNTAFNSVFARIWQFTIGSIACLKSTANDHHQYQKVSTDDVEENVLPSNKVQVDVDVTEMKPESASITGIIAILVFLMGFGQAIDPTVFLRLVVTCLTGYVILSGNFSQSVLLTNPVMVYIGDISYSLYLVHWPICVCIENYYPGYVDASISGIISSFLLAIILTETYERWYLKAHYVVITILLLVLVGVNITVLRATTFKADLMNINYKLIYNVNCDHEVENNPLGWCNFTRGLNKSSPNTGLIIGNSYSANLGGLVWENCGIKVNKLRQYSKATCEPLIVTRFTTAKCGGEFAKFLKFVELEKPDYLFLLARWIDLSLKVPPGKADEALKAAEKRMTEYSQLVNKKIFVLHGFPTPKWEAKKVYEERYLLTKEKTRFDDLFDATLDNTILRLRLEALAKKFPKMVLIDIQAPLIINGTFRVGDPTNGMSYFTSDLHISPHGRKTINPAFQEACKDL